VNAKLLKKFTKKEVELIKQIRVYTVLKNKILKSKFVTVVVETVTVMAKDLFLCHVGLSCNTLSLKSTILYIESMNIYFYFTVYC
jgi:hypothetical protein